MAPHAAGDCPWRVAAVLIGVLSLAVASLLLAVMVRPAVDDRLAAVRNSPLWAPLFADDLPVQLVLGDYYIFGERGDAGEIRRLVRDFNVNSAADLERDFVADPALTRKFADLKLGYLPTSSAQALREVLPVLVASASMCR